MSSLEYSRCLSALCWLYVWRIQLFMRVDTSTVLVRALRSLISWWDCIVFLCHILCLTWSNFEAVCCRTPIWLCMTSGGFSWNIYFSWYNLWYLFDRSCTDWYYWSILFWYPYLVFHLPCHILRYPLMNLSPHTHRIFNSLEYYVLNSSAGVYLFAQYYHKIDLLPHLY